LLGAKHKENKLNQKKKRKKKKSERINKIKKKTPRIWKNDKAKLMPHCLLSAKLKKKTNWTQNKINK